MSAFTAVQAAPRRAAGTLAAVTPAALLGLAIFAGLAAISAKVLNDPDTQWHVAAGRWMWAEGRLPTLDPFSFTFAGAPWIAKEWFSQLVLYAAFALAGWAGVALATSAVLAACLAGLYGWLAARMRSTLALSVVALAFVMGSPQFLARPHVLAVPAMLVWTMGLVRALERERRPSLALLAAMVAWANLHASFPLGLVLAALLACEAILRAPASERPVTVARWGAFGIASLLAACATPYGFKTVLLVVAFVNTPEATRYIGEWQPLGFDLQGFATLVALALAVAMLAPDWRRSAFRLLVVALLGYLSIRHQRFTLPFAMMAPILVAGPAMRRYPALGPSNEIVPGRVAGALLAVLLAADLAAVALVRPLPSPAVTPTAALAYARAAHIAGPVYNEYDFGGTLILDGIKTFIDGRSDQLFAGGFTTNLYRAVDAGGDKPFADLMRRYDIHWALVRPGSDDARHLVAMGWRKPYEDRVAALYTRP